MYKTVLQTTAAISIVLASLAAYAQNDAEITELTNQINKNNVTLFNNMNKAAQQIGEFENLYCAHDYDAAQGGGTVQWCHQNQCVDVHYYVRGIRSPHDLLGIALGFGMGDPISRAGSTPTEIRDLKRQEIQSCKAVSAQGYKCNFSGSEGTCIHDTAGKFSVTNGRVSAYREPKSNYTQDDSNSWNYASSAAYRTRYYRSPRDRLLRRPSYRY